MSIIKSATPICRSLIDIRLFVLSSSKSRTSVSLIFESCLQYWLSRNKRAVGVQYVSDVIGRSGGVTTLLTARASRLVVLSSGAFGSPAILERSGIGEKSVLEKVGVKVLVDLPGVGEHYLGT